jgi:sigma-B regulation protein RsbU (phosphoserine phosphatase)
VFTRKVLRREPWVLWTKLRLAALGLAVGALPIALAAVARQVWPAAPVPLEKVAVLLLPLVPASFSVALLRTRAIDLSDLLRQGLITLALTLLLVPPAAAFLMVAGPLLSGAGRGLGYLLTVLAVFALSVSAVPARRRIGTAIDHLLYPEQQTQRARAQSLAAALNQQRDPQQLAQLLCADLLSLFHGSSAALYACDAEAMQLQAQSGTVSERPLPVRVAREASLLAEVFRSSEMILVEPMLTGPRPVHLDEESRKLLATGCALLCPLAAGGRPVGLLAMGPPRGGGMFGTFELHEIRMLAGHTAAALENAILHREDLARERLAAEMALAREIQAHLMPASDLAAGPFTVSGKMISSAQVGGDVFDHFTLGDGRVVMAVADASGKGVPASLLMSSMRPAIREAMQPGSTLVQAVARLNRHVHAMTSERHFIALFLAALEPTTHVMTYVVAGLDPPLWVRARLGRVEQLTRGGPVLGIDLTAGFREGVIRLLPGDVLLAYTDGMIDQENATGEPFGTARLSAWTRRLKDLPAAEIRAGLFAAVEEFGPGPAADDKTLLVLKFDAPAQAGTEAAEASAGA